MEHKINEQTELTNNQKQVLCYLRVNEERWVPPTEIGEELMGIGYHSSWASPICKKLVAFKLAVRNEKGHYKARIK